MKKYILYSIKFFLFLALMVAFASCEEDFLEKPAGSDVTIDTVFATPTNAQQMIMKLYQDRYYSPDNLPIIWWDDAGWLSWSAMGEDLYFPQAKWTRHWQYVDGTMNSSSKQLYKLPDLYEAVRVANIFIERAATIPKNTDKEKEYIDFMCGEAHAQLAYQYFKGFRIWGSIPWVNKALEGDEDPIERAPINQLIDSIVSRFDIAAEMLPEKWEDKWEGRFTSVAAKALKAKVLVYAASDLYNNVAPIYAGGYEHPEYLGYGTYDQQRWERAADACKEAIDAAHAAGHKLYEEAGVEKNIYELAIKKTDEHILYQRLSNGSLVNWEYAHNMMNYPYGIAYSNRNDLAMQPTFQHVDGYQMRNGVFPINGYKDGGDTVPNYTQKGIDAGYSDQDFAKNRDPRFHQNIVYHGSTFGESYNSKLINFDQNTSVANRTHGDWPSFRSGFMVRKFVNEAVGESDAIKYTPIHPIIRLADLYLLYAEALNRFNVGPNADAIDYLNKIRTRSGMPNYVADNYNGSTAEDKFQNAIKYERRVEFFLEGQRYFDLRRWRNGDDLELSLVGAKIENGLISRKDLNWTNKWDDKLYFHPFHQKEWVNVTPGFLQNPGY